MRTSSGRRAELERLAGKVGNAELQRLVAREGLLAEINTDRPTPLVAQPTEFSCWAASMAMVVSRREGRDVSPQQIGEGAGMSLRRSYSWSDIQRAVSAWGVRIAAPAIGQPEPWKDMLRRLGPLWIVQSGDPMCAVVLIGMKGTGSVDGTMVKLPDPWPPGDGAVEHLTFREFNDRHGAGAGSPPQIVHA